MLCWPELKAGDRVKIRPGNANTRPECYGQEGEINEVIQMADHGTLYVATIANEKEAFIRSELIRIIDCNSSANETG